MAMTRVTLFVALLVSGLASCTVIGAVWQAMQEEEALADAERATDLGSKRSADFVTRGSARADKEDWEGAIADLDQALSLDPGDLNALDLRAYVWSRKGEPKKAIADFNAAIRQKPSCWRLSGRAEIWFELGEIDESIADFSEAIRLDPRSQRAYYNRGLIREKNGDLDGAIADYNESIRLDPTVETVYYDRGNARSAKSDLDGAIADYTEAIRRNPQYCLAYNNRGLVWKDKGDPDRAMSDFAEAIRVDPKNALAYHNRGVTWHSKERFDEAVKDYSEALRLEPSDELTWFVRGLAWEKSGDFEKALRDFSEAARLAPTYADAYYAQAYIMAACPEPKYRDGRRAVELATKACELTAWKGEAHVDALAAAFAESGNFEKAVEWQTKALELKRGGTNPDERIKDFEGRLALYKSGQPYRYELTK